MYTDETLNCNDCGRSFEFTASEQEFFASKGFTNKPSRCADCRAARKASGGGRSGMRQTTNFPHVLVLNENGDNHRSWTHPGQLRYRALST